MSDRRTQPFAALARTITRRPGITLGIMMVLVALALYSAIQIKPATGIQDMLADDQPSAIALANMVDRFALIDDLIIIARLPADQPADPQPLIDFAQRLETQLADEPTVATYRYKQSPQMQEFIESVLLPHGLFYLDDAQRDALRHRLTPEAMQDQFKQNASMLAMPGPAAGRLSKELIRDPLRLRDFLAESSMGNSNPFQTLPGTDAMVSTDARAIMIRISGQHSANNLDFTKDFMPRIRDAVEQADPQGLIVDYTGGYAIAEHSATQTQNDMALSCTWSIVLLIAFFLLVYKNPFAFPLLLLPVMLAIIVGFGLYAAVSGRLTPVTAVSGAVLAGLGIDYCVHYLSHYEDHRGLATSEQATIATTTSVGPAIAAACLTTLIGFGAILLASVRSLREFSLLGVLGLAAAMIASITVMPALLVLLNRLPIGRRTWSASRVNLRPMVRLIAAHRRISAIPLAFIAVSCVIILGVASYHDDGFGWPIKFDSDLTALHPRPHPPLDAQDLVMQYFGATPDALMVYLHAESPDAMVTLSHQVQARLADPSLDDLGIGAIVGPGTVLPDPLRPRPKTFDIDKIVSDLFTAADSQGFNPKAFDDYGDFLRTLLTQTKPPTVEQVWAYPEVAGAMLPTDEPQPRDGLVLATMLKPWDTVPQRDAGIEAVRDALADLPGATLTGLPVVGYDTQQAIGDELGRLLGVAGILVFIWLLVFFRRPTHVMLALLPATIGIAILLAIMSVFGLQFNAVNLIAAPLLVGIGVDDGIFLTAIYRRVRLNELDRETLITELASSAQAVVMTSATTALAFGSLVFTHVPAIRSLGLLTALGVACALIATLLGLLPVLVSLRIRQTR